MNPPNKKSGEAMLRHRKEALRSGMASASFMSCEACLLAFLTSALEFALGARLEIA
jgi:hypothetical protein